MSHRPKNAHHSDTVDIFLALIMDGEQVSRVTLHRIVPEPFHLHVTSKVALGIVSIPVSRKGKRHRSGRHLEGFRGPGLGGDAHHFLSHSVVQNPVLSPHLTRKGSGRYSALVRSHVSVTM